MKTKSVTGLLLLCLLCGCKTQLFNFLKTVTVEIKSSIPNAVVVLDGDTVGIAPLSIPLRPRKRAYRVQVESLDPAYTCSFDQNFHFLPKVNTTIDVACKAKKSVTLTIQSDDSQAVVLLNTDTVNWHNQLLISPGKYKVQILGQSFGFGQYEEELDFEPFSTHTLFKRLQQDTSTWTNGEIELGAIRIGNQWWMDQNLKKIGEDYTCYDEDDKNCETYGALYNWYEAVDVAKQIEGWRLPSDEDWRQLEFELGMGKATWDSLKWRGNPIGNALKQDGSSGFDARYGGYLHFDGDIYAFLEESGYYWTSSDTSMEETDLGALRYVKKKEARLYRDFAFKTYGFSVRLIKDTP